jgi:hypothetical protein
VGTSLRRDIGFAVLGVFAAGWLAAGSAASPASNLCSEAGLTYPVLSKALGPDARLGIDAADGFCSVSIPSNTQGYIEVKLEPKSQYAVLKQAQAKASRPEASVAPGAYAVIISGGIVASLTFQTRTHTVVLLGNYPQAPYPPIKTYVALGKAIHSAIG